MSIHLAIKNENHSNPRTATPEIVFFGESSWGYDMSCSWKQGLGFGKDWNLVKEICKEYRRIGTIPQYCHYNYFYITEIC